MARRRKRRGSRIADELSASFDGRTVVYGFGKLDALVPAYAATVHKSHGSEYPAVVIPVLTQHYAMLRRNLLYTGVTRGKRGRIGGPEEGGRHRGAQRVGAGRTGFHTDSCPCNRSTRG